MHKALSQHEQGSFPAQDNNYFEQNIWLCTIRGIVLLITLILQMKIMKLTEVKGIVERHKISK